MGNVLGAGLGQAPARQAAVHAGVPETSSALTVNKMCASGLMSVILGTQMVKTGDVGMMVAGGMESMSRAPHVLDGSRDGKRLGNWELTDTLVNDGLWCCFNDRHMGHLAEGTATAFEVSREEQDPVCAGEPSERDGGCGQRGLSGRDRPGGGEWTERRSRGCQ